MRPKGLLKWLSLVLLLAITFCLGYLKGWVDTLGAFADGRIALDLSIYRKIESNNLKALTSDTAVMLLGDLEERAYLKQNIIAQFPWRSLPPETERVRQNVSDAMEIVKDRKWISFERPLVDIFKDLLQGTDIKNVEGVKEVTGAEILKKDSKK